MRIGVSSIRFARAWASSSSRSRRRASAALCASTFSMAVRDAGAASPRGIRKFLPYPSATSFTSPALPRVGTSRRKTTFIAPPPTSSDLQPGPRLHYRTYVRYVYGPRLNAVYRGKHEWTGGYWTKSLEIHPLCRDLSTDLSSAHV